jgi:hypothetical protein
MARATILLKSPFLLGASNLKKLLKGHFFINFLHGNTKKLRKELNPKPFG